MIDLNFIKMHGLGNDFVMIDLRTNKFPSLKKNAKLICDRHMGIGCDQIITIEPSSGADYKMRVFNADGDEAEMCGNGIRCFAKFLWNREEKIIHKKKSLNVETKAGIIIPRIVDNDLVEVDMGEPILSPGLMPTTLKGEKIVDRSISTSAGIYSVTLVSMGNPHCIIFTDDLEKIDLESVGPQIESDPVFPNRTNVEFVEVISEYRVKTRVWERGSGITLACGTGACAVAVAANLNGHTGRSVRVDLPGGSLRIQWTKDNRILMTGPAVEVYSGRIKI